MIRANGDAAIALSRKNKGIRLKFPAYKIVWAQLVVTAACVVLSFLLVPQSIGSALLGGLCCVLPNSYFVLQAFRFSGARSAKRIVRAFYVGELGKILLTVAMFTITFASIKPAHPAVLFVVYSTVQSVYWLAPVLLRNKIKTA